MSIYELLDSFEIDYQQDDYWSNGIGDYAIVSGPDNSEMWLSLEDDRVYMTIYALDDSGCLIVEGDDSFTCNEVPDKLLEWDGYLTPVNWKLEEGS